MGSGCSGVKKSSVLFHPPPAPLTFGMLLNRVIPGVGCVAGHHRGWAGGSRGMVTLSHPLRPVSQLQL